MHETAIVVGVPKAERLFGRWRRLYTQDGRDGMGAHVTLLYPFADDARVDSDLPQVRSVLGHFSPFVCSFRGTARFPEDGVLYLRPEPDEIFRAMTDALAQAFPLHPPYGGAYGDLVPH